MSFKDKCVIVTGASGNLGRAVVRAFAERGANLVLVDRNAAAVDGALMALGYASGERFMPAIGDLLDQAQVATLVQSAVQRFGGAHVLCNLAGGFRMGEAVHETSDGNWNFLFDINARTLLHTARAVVPQMLAQPAAANGTRGKIVNVGAFTAQRGAAHMGAYSASKATVIRITESMAAELREQGINVNCVLPTIIDTPENREAMADADHSRWVAPEALAEVIVFLASDSARAVHGAALPVTGLS